MELIIPHQPCHIPITADKIGGGHLTKLGPSDTFPGIWNGDPGSDDMKHLNYHIRQVCKPEESEKARAENWG